MAIDANTILLLSCDDGDGSTTFTDTGANAHTISVVADAKQKIDQFKFITGSSLYLDGTGDQLEVPDDVSWDWLTNNNTPFTIDMWVRFDSTASNRGFIGQDAGINHAWGFYWSSVGNYIAFHARKSFQNQEWRASWTPLIDTWYHIEATRDSSNNRYLFVDGVELTLTTDTKSTAWSSGASAVVTVGYTNVDSKNARMSGWLDEIRISDVARHTTGFTPETIPYGPPAPVPPAEVLTIDKWLPATNRPNKAQPVTNPGFSVTPGMEVPVPIKMDKWQNLSQPPARIKPHNPANTTQYIFVDFTVPTLPEVLMSQWKDIQCPRKPKAPVKLPTAFASSDIAALNPVNGNYFDSGVYGFTITAEHVEDQTYKDSGVFGLTITAEHVEDFQLADTEAISFTISYPDTGVETFNSGVPGFVSASVFIDGLNESDFCRGIISVTREDNAAARFNLNLEEDPDALLPRKPVEFINKGIIINFAAADMDGVVSDYTPIFIGVIKGVSFNEDQRTLKLSGYDYNGVHQTRGEFISENITDVLAGSIGASSAGILSTGFNPIWGVEWQGSSAVVDGQDYFVDTQNGDIIIPISSRILQYPGHFTYNYANHFSSMKAIIEAIASQKSWVIEEDGVTIADYTTETAHPVLSLSDESVIDTCRKFLELSGAKLEGNLFPKLRVYSEVENWINPVSTLVVNESAIFEDTLTYSIDFEGILNEQTTRSVQRVNANIAISAGESIAEFSGSQGSINPLSIQGGTVGGIDYTTPAVLVEHRISKQGLNSISLSSSGTFTLFVLPFETFTEAITGSSWEYFTDGDDFVIQLKHKVESVGGGGVSLIAFPAIEYSLTVNGAKIQYGGGSPEDVRVVTSQRPISGITETLKGDVYENPYIETDQHCTNINNAVLLEHGNPYTAQFEIPVFTGKTAQIGSRVDIQRNSSTIFSGIIKRLNYSMDLKNGINKITVGARGIGKGI